MMKKLGMTNLKVSKQGLGCMSMSEFYGNPISDEVGISLITKAVENGVNFFDTADVYGYGRNELLVGKAVSYLVASGVDRSTLVIATKCGIVRDEHDTTKRGLDNSYSYIKDCCHKSLSRLDVTVGYIDLFYLHRIAENGVHIDEAMKAMSELIEEGKIRAVGLSEASPEIIKKANESLLKFTNNRHQLAAVQSEYSLLTRLVENNGVLNTCRQLGITLVAYSPLSRALLTGHLQAIDQLDENDSRRNLPRFKSENLTFNNSIVNKIKKIADRNSCTVAQVSLAWVMHQDGVIPIPGTIKETHLLSNIHANVVSLSTEDLNSLNSLEEAHGYRYAEEAMKAYGFNDELNDSLSMSDNKRIE